MSPRSNWKTALGQRSTLIKDMTSMSCKLEPAIWSRDTGQRITWFDRCHLSKKYTVNQGYMSLPTFYLEHGRQLARLHRRPCRAHPRAILLAMITMRKSIHGFPLVSMGMGLRLVGVRPPEFRYKLSLHQYWLRSPCHPQHTERAMFHSA